MAPGDLLKPLEGQRDETLRLLSGLSEADLAREEPDTGWTVRQHLCHIASAELGEAFVIRMAAQGELVHMTREDRDEFNEAEVEKCADWPLDRLKSELEDARANLREVFVELTEEDLDRPIRWPDWPARTIRTTIPYMLEHEDSHLDLVRRALEKSRT
jgi:uncharacterized damage-inducible protein DinB